MSLIIDAHQHFWRLDRFDYEWLNAPQLAKIKRDYLPLDLQPLLEQVGVRKSIFVQTQHNIAETDWVLALAHEYDFLAGVVGWVDLASEDCERQVEQFKDQPLFVGVRHVTHDEPDDDFIVREDSLRGLRVLEKHRVPFDLLFYPRHLKHVPTIVEHCPNLPLVIDHLAKPNIKDRVLQPWLDDLRQAASFPNVYCKLSGMVTEANWTNWTPADLRPYIDHALELFGPERCMFGSDWPVCELAGTYQEVFQALAENVAELSSSEQAAIFGQTAVRFYGLRV
jgi:L-fuconolactonase